MAFLYGFRYFRISISILRYLFFNALGQFKTFYKKEDRSKDDLINYDSGETALTHNLVYRSLPNKFSWKQIRKKLLQFSGNKAELLVYPLKAIDFVDYKNFKVLSIGPRVESELMTIRSLGFKWKNIKAVDLHSYSKLIKLGDMHQLDYDDNSFDLIVSGWTLRYSNNVYKALSEILRVIKPGGLVSIGFTYASKADKEKNFKSKTNKTKDNDIYSTNQIKEYFKDNIRTVYFEFDAFKDNPDVSRASILLLRVKK